MSVWVTPTGVALPAATPYSDGHDLWALQVRGWFNSALGIGALFVSAPLQGAPFLLLGLFLWSVGYSVSTVLCLRLPWVRDDA